MRELLRNHLVRLNESGWQGVLAQTWDSQARIILNHWYEHHLPLVVCQSRNPTAQQIASLGLPAPTVWDRRKLCLEIAHESIESTERFPVLNQVCGDFDFGTLVQDFLQRMQALRVPVHVYGSYGWQWLTGLTYVRNTSDLDLIAEVPDQAIARQATVALQSLCLPCRVDGELMFPSGHALAWREFAQGMNAHVDQVLVKNHRGAQLMALHAL